MTSVDQFGFPISMHAFALSGPSRMELNLFLCLTVQQKGSFCELYLKLSLTSVMTHDVLNLH